LCTSFVIIWLKCKIKFSGEAKKNKKHGSSPLPRFSARACTYTSPLVYINYNSVFEIRSWPVRRELNYPRSICIYRIADAPVKSNLRPLPPLQPLYKVLCRPHAAAIYTKTTTGDSAILITATTHRRGSAWALINDWSRRRRASWSPPCRK